MLAHDVAGFGLGHREEEARKIKWRTNGFERVNRLSVNSVDAWRPVYENL